jgi:hypothetical protein
MTQTTSGASETHGSAATKPLDTAEDNPWWGQNAPEVSLRWWESVPTAYWQGLVDGDDIVHRTAVRGAIRLVVRTERRERADRGEAAT